MKVQWDTGKCLLAANPTELEAMPPVYFSVPTMGTLPLCGRYCFSQCKEELQAVASRNGDYTLKSI